MASKVEIITDGRWKPLKYREEVPKRVLAGQFDYLSDEVVDGFLKYRGTWYHVTQFMRVPEGEPGVGKWDGYAPDGFSSGVVIKLSSDVEEYMIGTYTS